MMDNLKEEFIAYFKSKDMGEDEIACRMKHIKISEKGVFIEPWGTHVCSLAYIKSEENHENVSGELSTFNGVKIT